MAIVNIPCSECNGSGRVLKHYYNRDYANTFGNAGAGMGNCPRCHGSGKVQRSISDKSNAKGSESNDIATFEATAFVVVWGILFYLTSQAYASLFEFITGYVEFRLPEFPTWVKVALTMVPPTVVVYLFRKYIPSLFLIGIVALVLSMFIK